MSGQGIIAELRVAGHVPPGVSSAHFSERRTEQCWCLPREEDDVIVHNSMDEREKYETGERKLS